MEDIHGGILLHFHSGIIFYFVALWFIHVMMAEKANIFI